MPYTTLMDRERYRVIRDVVSRCHIHSAGDLAYLITQLVDRFLDDKPLCWDTISDAHKAVEAARIAFEQDIYIPYERNKRDSNGEVFT